MANYLNFPFDAELFYYLWQNEKDPTLTNLLDSGAVRLNSAIKNLISTGSDTYTIPFNNVLSGTPTNYDGAIDVGKNEVTGKSQSGIVAGRTIAFTDRDFIHDYNSGADPTRQILSQITKFWAKDRQNRILYTLRGIYNIADDSSDAWDEWQKHTFNIATATNSVATSNKVGVTTLGDATQKAVGDNSNIFRLAIMHSLVAKNLANLELLDYRKYTDLQGIQRTLAIADWNGRTAIIDDGVPVANSGSAAGEKDYTTYLFGEGAIHYADAPVKAPVEMQRDGIDDGGLTYLITRIRETFHPDGFTFVKPQGYTASPTDVHLGSTASGTSNWTISGNPKNIAIARIISNG